MNMNRSKGYSLIEIAIVLLILSILIAGFTAGFSHYKDRAEYIGSERNSELDDLIAMGKGTPQVAPEPEAAPEVVVDPMVDPVVDPVVEPEVVVDNASPWERFWNWLRNRRNRRGA